MTTTCVFAILILRRWSGTGPTISLLSTCYVSAKSEEQVVAKRGGGMICQYYPSADILGKFSQQREAERQSYELNVWQHLIKLLMDTLNPGSASLLLFLLRTPQVQATLNCSPLPTEAAALEVNCQTSANKVWRVWSNLTGDSLPLALHTVCLPGSLLGLLWEALCSDLLTWELQGGAHRTGTSAATDGTMLRMRWYHQYSWHSTCIKTSRFYPSLRLTETNKLFMSTKSPSGEVKMQEPITNRGHVMYPRSSVGDIPNMPLMLQSEANGSSK
ncbi:uncharacterized protein LOC107510477 [Rousettus aegyptiacus]|uniref:uncharacterized protein LOC107510477 n=1 Tax=Rousettus aegyptiacus TaxID=9407 RepID=UPI00168CE853|nr:uncharacterized protein LOC107510477 [Rousettus aegyptiacus]